MALRPPSPSAATPAAWGWGAAGLFLVLAAVLALLLIARQRRHRREVRALIARLEALQARNAQLARPTGAEADGKASQTPAASSSTTLPLLSPSGDVLAGLTSRVQHLVAGEGAAAESLADQAIVGIHRRLAANITPQQLASELYVSLRTLERGLSVALDCTPRQLILAMKMREARRLLVNEDLQVSEVAERVGFTSPYHFSRRFKEFYGVPPSQLRDRESRAA